LKITKIETFRPLAHPSSLWVEIHDDKGNVGLGTLKTTPAALRWSFICSSILAIL
jgi:L-alanine-DL-glutamate epimerase-like enolase superfamily enzyme